MGRSGRLFPFLLLASVLLNLGDAPYIDEIFDGFVPHHIDGVMVLRSNDADAQSSGSGKTSPAAFYGYQLLVSGLAVVSFRDPKPAVVYFRQTSLPEYFFSFSSLPPGRIDRPPRRDFTQA